MKQIIRTTDPGVQYIAERDPLFAKLTAMIGDIEITLRTDYLPSIVRSIVGQQISVSAASAIYARLIELLEGEITVPRLLSVTEEELHRAGLTKRKAQYVKDLAQKIADGSLDLEHLADYDDETVMKQLVNVKGIGKWTAEMFLIFSLGRQDILAVDDVGLQRAAAWLYGTEQAERRSILIEKSPLWQPHRSIASFYLWEITHLAWNTDYPSLSEAALKLGESR